MPEIPETQPTLSLPNDNKASEQMGLNKKKRDSANANTSAQKKRGVSQSTGSLPWPSSHRASVSAGCLSNNSVVSSTVAAFKNTIPDSKADAMKASNPSISKTIKLANNLTKADKNTPRAEPILQRRDIPPTSTPKNLFEYALGCNVDSAAPSDVALAVTTSLRKVCNTANEFSFEFKDTLSNSTLELTNWVEKSPAKQETEKSLYFSKLAQPDGTGLLFVPDSIVKLYAQGDLSFIDDESIRSTPFLENMERPVCAQYGCIKRDITETLYGKKCDQTSTGFPSPVPIRKTFLKKQQKELRKKSSSSSTLNLISTPCGGLPRHVVKLMASAVAQLASFTQSNVAVDKNWSALITQDANCSGAPTFKVIYKYIMNVVTRLQITTEVVVFAVIYLVRFLRNTGIGVTHESWKRLILGALVVAAKSCDDEAIWNSDFFTAVPRIGASVSEIFEIERVYLEQLGYDLNVCAVEYASWYFALHRLYGPTTREPMKRNAGLSLNIIKKPDFSAIIPSSSTSTASKTSVVPISTLDSHTFVLPLGSGDDILIPELPRHSRRSTAERPCSSNNSMSGKDTVLQVVLRPPLAPAPACLDPAAPPPLVSQRDHQANPCLRRSLSDFDLTDRIPASLCY